MLQDHVYVHREMKRLKEKEIYPFQFRKEALHTNEMILRRICNWLLPVEPIFWLLHYIYSAINHLKYMKEVTKV